MAHGQIANSDRMNRLTRSGRFYSSRSWPDCLGSMTQVVTIAESTTDVVLSRQGVIPPPFEGSALPFEVCGRGVEPKLMCLEKPVGYVAGFETET